MKPPPGRRHRRPPAPADPGAGLPPLEAARRRLARLRETPVAELGLPVRVVNALDDLDLILAGALVDADRATLLAARSLGAATLKDLAAAVTRIGLAPHPTWVVRKPRRKKPKPKKPTR